jgi:hypothetical protein
MTLHDHKFSSSNASTRYIIVPLHETKVTEIISRQAPYLTEDEMFAVPDLRDIRDFHETVCALDRKSPTKMLVFQMGTDKACQATLAFLMGCHMMLSHGLGFEETYLSFGRLHSIMDPQSRDGPHISVKSCLRAFCRAKCFEWFMFNEHDDGLPEKHGTMHIDEYLHYARYQQAIYTYAINI